MSSLAGRICLVLGGTRGIGKATCQVLAQRGANVVVSGRNTDDCKAICEQLVIDNAGLQGQRHFAIPCDITEEKAVEKSVSFVENEIGPIYAVVNSAGVLKSSLLLRAKTSDIEKQLNTNLLGTLFACRAALKHMMKRRQGHIVNIGSVVGLKGLAGESVYSATKAGLVGLTKSLAKEVGPKNICVNLVCPGFVQTAMTSNLKEEDFKSLIALGRFAQPNEIAEAVAFILESTYITGQILTVDGGLLF